MTIGSITAMISIVRRSAVCIACMGVAAAAGPMSVPQAPADATSREVTFAGGAEGVTLAGTLLLPAGATPEARVPAVVLVTGSGPQDRDETIAGRKPFLVLANALAREGFAVLRYDDRGTEPMRVGKSTGVFGGATLRDTSEDAAAAMAFAAQQPEIDPKRIVICGHSTGGLEAAMLLGAGRVPAGAILLATPAVAGASLLAQQSAAILRANHEAGKVPLTEEQIARSIELQHAVIMAAATDDILVQDRAAEEAVRFVLALKSPGQPVDNDTVRAAVEQALAPLTEPWMAHFLRYDPASDLAAAKVPVLIVYGGRDLQVAPELNAQPATDALKRSGQPQTMIVTLPTANHLFQQANTGLLDEYGTLTDEMGPALTGIVTEWLDMVLEQDHEEPAGAEPAPGAGARQRVGPAQIPF